MTGRAVAADHGEGWLSLLCLILEDSPRLPGALCRGLAPRWDLSYSPQRIRAAIATCEICPARSACAEFRDRRRGHHSGVWAGEILGGKLDHETELETAMTT